MTDVPPEIAERFDAALRRLREAADRPKPKQGAQLAIPELERP